MPENLSELDVRPTLRAGGEPFAEIMAAVNNLQPGQGLRLLATFKPVPLFSVLGAQGFTHEEREIGDGDWEILFHPAGAKPDTAAAPSAPAAAPATPAQSGRVTLDDMQAWPEPLQHMDNRDLDPPEPMVRIMDALGQMKQGEVLSAFLCREPPFLIPEIESRGHAWYGAFEPDGTTYKIIIRVNESATA